MLWVLGEFLIYVLTYVHLCGPIKYLAYSLLLKVLQQKVETKQDFKVFCVNK